MLVRIGFKIKTENNKIYVLEGRFSHPCFGDQQTEGAVLDLDGLLTNTKYKMVS